MRAELLMPLGEQCAEDARTASDLAELGARGREQVGDLTLLRQAAGHQQTPDTA